MDHRKMKEVEEKILEKWKKEKTFEKVKESLEGEKRFFFLDGPPYANGEIHMGHAWNKSLKDTYIRFQRMQGKNVWCQPGYDTHGLPIENKVEGKLDLKQKSDIEEFGIENFIKECEKFATKHIDAMNQEFKNLGVWMDWDRPYITLHNDYIEGAWFTFKEAYKKDLLYKGKYPVHVCPHCETAVAYNEIEYINKSDPSVFVKFPVRNKEGEYLVIYTTTPWTLPANTGIMVNPNKDYVYVSAKGEKLILAENLVEEVMKKSEIENYEIEKTVKGDELVGTRYDNPLKDYLNYEDELENAYRVIPSDQHASVEEGSGLVHSAPGHGKEDYEVGKEHDLPILSPVGLDGKYTEEVKSPLANVFVKDADDKIKEMLDEMNVLLYQGSITHEYPKCWRCDTPLLFVSVPQWFFRVTAFRDKLIEENEEINWMPDWAGSRFENWLLSLGDWPISRQRYWGIPLPIWECSTCDSIKVIGSSDELGAELDDLHKPFIDVVKLDCNCGGEMKRIPDVLDVWFDSGVAPWASLNYPKNKEPFESLWPVDLVIEGPDQIRGWWNSLMITGLVTMDRRPMNNVIFHGFTLNEGKKMSKSRGNGISPKEVIDKYGRDVLRFYLLSKPPWEDFNFSWDEVEDVRRFFNTLTNTYNFLETYGEDVEKVEDLNTEDEWILSKLNSLVKKNKDLYDKLEAHKAVGNLRKFVLNDLSRWYIKIIRDRMWPQYEGDDKKAAFYTLNKVFETLAKIMSPVAPFITEEIWSSLGNEDSIHLERWPEVGSIDEKLEEDMNIARNALESVNAARSDEGISLRWPVKSITIHGSQKVVNSIKALEDILSKMANAHEIKTEVESVDYEVKLNYGSVGKKYGSAVKQIEKDIQKEDPEELNKTLEEDEEVKIGDHVLDKDDIEFRVPEGDYSFLGGRVEIDTSQDDSIKRERLYRELIRNIQEQRKENEMNVEERIKLTVNCSDDFKDFLEDQDLETSVGASDLDFSDSGQENETKYEDLTVSFSFTKK